MFPKITGTKANYEHIHIRSDFINYSLNLENLFVSEDFELKGTNLGFVGTRNTLLFIFIRGFYYNFLD